MIARAFDKCGISWKDLEGDGHLGDSSVMLAPFSQSDGLNGLVVCDFVVCYSNVYSQERRSQMEHRFVRRGQKSPVVRIIDLVSKLEQMPRWPMLYKPRRSSLGRSSNLCAT